MVSCTWGYKPVFLSSWPVVAGRVGARCYRARFLHTPLPMQNGFPTHSAQPSLIQPLKGALVVQSTTTLFLKNFIPFGPTPTGFHRQIELHSAVQPMSIFPLLTLEKPQKIHKIDMPFCPVQNAISTHGEASPRQDHPGSTPREDGEDRAEALPSGRLCCPWVHPRLGACNPSWESKNTLQG